jgi:hypothetical protein
MALGSRLKYYEDVNLGRVFLGSTAVAGVVPAIFSNTAQTFALWNPLGSGKNIVPLKLQAGYVSTTGAAGNLALAYNAAAGSQVGTGSPIAAGTFAAPVNALLGGNGDASVAKFAPATITFTGAPLFLRTLGMSQLVTTAADATTTPWMLETDFDGSLVLAPGAIICVAGNIATLSVWNFAMTWAEIDA